MPCRGEPVTQSHRRSQRAASCATLNCCECRQLCHAQLLDFAGCAHMYELQTSARHEFETETGQVCARQC